VGVGALETEGRERTWARHAAIAAGAAAGLEALGLRLVAAADHRSATVTAAWLPDGTDWSALDERMRGAGLVVAGGQGKWTGKILRLGHMGDVGWDEIEDALGVMATAWNEFGSKADPATVREVGRRAYRASVGAPVSAR
jgi:aspartate aminotransferase-like enzyme